MSMPVLERHDPGQASLSLENRFHALGNRIRKVRDVCHFEICSFLPSWQHVLSQLGTSRVRLVICYLQLGSCRFARVNHPQAYYPIRLGHKISPRSYAPSPSIVLFSILSAPAIVSKSCVCQQLGCLQTCRLPWKPTHCPTTMRLQTTLLRARASMQVLLTKRNPNKTTTRRRIPRFPVSPPRQGYGSSIISTRSTNHFEAAQSRSEKGIFSPSLQ